MADDIYRKAVDYWHSRNVDSGARVNEVMGELVTEYAYHTTKYAEPSVTMEIAAEVIKNGEVNNYSGDVRPLFALYNAARGWRIMLDTYDKEIPVDAAVIKRFHRALSEGLYADKLYFKGERPGKYKVGNYVTGRYKIGALPADVPEEIDELVEDISDVGDDKALTAAAFFHAKFENIHAFADDNGRVGRLLMNYFLIRHNHPVIIIHEEDKDSYMRALEQWDSVQKLELLKEFLKEQTIKTWKGHIE